MTNAAAMQAHKRFGPADAAWLRQHLQALVQVSVR
jgi:hypothetical protein